MKTLLPYLQSPAGEERLKLSLFPPGFSCAEKIFPFALLDDSAPYSRFIEAGFVTDSGAPLKKLFLQVQKDRYVSTGDTFRPVTNSDLDACWQERSRREGELILSTLVDEQGNLAQQGALFFCRDRKLFFHPVCPSCGLPLTLCTDDSFLKGAGLAPYSSSSKRYLYCSACCALGMQEVYLNERDHTDPVTVKDRWSLIDRFGGVDEVMDPEKEFPCARCPQHDRCYGAEKEARSRITPFSFYPFYLLVAEAPSLRAGEFLALASGADLDEVEELFDPYKTGKMERLRPYASAGVMDSLFAPGDPRFFLEVLFLKVSFLKEVLRQSASRGGRGGWRPDGERIWVNFSPAAAAVPPCWEFSVVLPDPVSPVTTLSSRGLSHDDRVHLGLLWFQSLLSNSRLQAQEVLQGVAGHMAFLRGDAAADEGALRRLCLPQNIFWYPGTSPVSDRWDSLWQRATAPGLRLLEGATQGGQGGIEELLQSLDALLADLKGAIFSGTAAGAGISAESTLSSGTSAASDAPPPQVEAAPNDSSELLRSVVQRLIAECRAELPAATKAEPDEDEDEVATLILSAPAAGAGKRAQIPEEDIAETVVLPPGAGYQPADAAMDDVITETVILSPRAPQPVPQPPPHEDLVGETVVLSSPRGTFPAARPNPDAALMETVISPPRQQSAQWPAAAQPSPHQGWHPAPPQQTAGHLPGPQGAPHQLVSEQFQQGPSASPPQPAPRPQDEGDELGETVVIMRTTPRPPGGPK